MTEGGTSPKAIPRGAAGKGRDKLTAPQRPCAEFAPLGLTPVARRRQRPIGDSVRFRDVTHGRRGFLSVALALRGSRGLGCGSGSGHVALAVEEASGVDEEAGRVN